MNIAIIDADLIGRKSHRFPNLACMKLSAYYKTSKNNVVLEKNYDNLYNYDKILISSTSNFSNVQQPHMVFNQSSACSFDK